MGLTVSVGMSAFYETWAAAARERNPGLIIGPARALRNVVDPDYPIAPNGGDLLWRFSTGRGPDTDRVRHPYRDWACLNWGLAATGNVDTAALETIGMEANAYLSKRGAAWQEYASPWSPEERKLLKEFGPQQRQARLIAHVTSDLPSRGFRASMVRERLHAFYHVITFHMLSTATGATTASQNDMEDLLSLQHIAEPAYLLTHDEKLIRAVDQSRTYQAPWVLRLHEIRGPSRASGRPWGESARAAAKSFSREECSGPCRICNR